MGANDKIVRGVLSIEDLAKLDDVPSESHLWAGTRPFLATNLPKPVRELHIERFDWESALHVLIWIITQYEDGDEMYMNVLQERSMAQMLPMRNWHISIPSIKGLI